MDNNSEAVRLAKIYIENPYQKIDGNPLPYCNSLTKYSRLKTREVMVGKIGIGGKNPIRVQSMTVTNTMDTDATVEETIRMVDARLRIGQNYSPEY